MLIAFVNRLRFLHFPRSLKLCVFQHLRGFRHPHCLLQFLELYPQLPLSNTVKDFAKTAVDVVEVVRPPPPIQDEVHFAVNNLSDSNLSEKARVVQAAITPQFLDWFAQYLVVTRVCVEPNFHQLYVQFLDAFENKATIHAVVLGETYKNIRLLLRQHFL